MRMSERDARGPEEHEHLFLFVARHAHVDRAHPCALKLMSERDARGRASVSVFGWKGGSPFQACPLRPVSDCNCVAARRGGEQRKEKKSSVG